MLAESICNRNLKNIVCPVHLSLQHVYWFLFISRSLFLAKMLTKHMKS